MWEVTYLEEAKEDLARLDGAVRKRVLAAIKKTASNPLPKNDPRNPGYGTPLGNQNSSVLTGFYKIKLRKDGIRVVYRLVRTETTMEIVVVGVRDSESVYREAVRRRTKHNI